MKKPFYVRVESLAKELGTSNDSVLKIVQEYISVCREEILDGYEVRIAELLRVVPKHLSNSSVSTVAYHCVQVSKRLSLPYYTVLSVIQRYLDGVRTDIVDGISVDFRAIATIHVIEHFDGYFILNSALSPALRRDYNNKYGCESGVRVFTGRLIRDELNLLQGR